eukprot:4518192-Pyramimonas_sp.AAC.1
MRPLHPLGPAAPRSPRVGPPWLAGWVLDWYATSTRHVAVGWHNARCWLASWAFGRGWLVARWLIEWLARWSIGRRPCPAAPARPWPVPRLPRRPFWPRRFRRFVYGSQEARFLWRERGRCESADRRAEKLGDDSFLHRLRGVAERRQTQRIVYQVLSVQGRLLGRYREADPLYGLARRSGAGGFQAGRRRQGPTRGCK